MFSRFVFIVAVLFAGLGLVSCSGPVPSSPSPVSSDTDTGVDDTQEGDGLAFRLASVGEPVVDTRVSFPVSGLASNMMVSVVVADGTVEVPVDVLRAVLVEVGEFVDTDFKGTVVLTVHEENFTPVSVLEPAVALGVDEDSIAIDETVTFYNVAELFELIASL